MGMAVGDARSLPVAAGSVQCVVTSPPYWGLRDYGVPGQLGLESTPDAYVANMVAVFREVWRVLRDDGTLWLNLGDSYAGPPVGTFNGGGFKDASAQTGGRDLSGIANGSKRSKVVAGLKPKDLVGIPWRVAFALQADGWYLRQDIIWAKPNPMPESVRDRCTKAHEYLFLLTKRQKYYYDAEAIREDVKPTSGINMRAPKCGPQRPTNNRDMNAVEYSDIKGANRRSVWTVNTQPYAEAHFATFPEKLVEPCILAGTKPGDLVLDPFAGSGTVGAVCRRLARRFVGVELNPKYVDLARARMARVQPGLALEVA